MSIFWIRTIQLLLSLSLLVVIHEFGHFMFARIFKTRVEAFYMFFNPSFSILRCKKINGKLKFKWFSKKSPKEFEKVPEKTEFGIGWIPLGGYCAISGMIDETHSELGEDEKPWEFRTKPAWQRLLIMVGGVLFNFILALVLYTAILDVWGEKYLPMENCTMGMDFSQVGHDVGFKDGDILLYADSIKVDQFNEVALRNIIEARKVKVRRGDSIVDIYIPGDMMNRLLVSGNGFASYRYPTVVKEVMNNSNAQRAGLQVGDSIVGVNGATKETFFDFALALSSLKDTTVTLSAIRNGVTITLNGSTDENGKLGFVAKNITEIYQTKTITYNILTAIPAGINKGIKKLSGYAGDMKYVFTEAGAKSLGGFGAIGHLFPSIWNWQIFWETTAFLSIILAFMNILPIPALDGGHILFLLVEIISRKKPNEKFLEYSQMVGMCILLILLIYANGNDLYRWLF